MQHNLPGINRCFDSRRNSVSEWPVKRCKQPFFFRSVELATELRPEVAVAGRPVVIDQQARDPGSKARHTKLICKKLGKFNGTGIIATVTVQDLLPPLEKSAEAWRDAVAGMFTADHQHRFRHGKEPLPAGRHRVRGRLRPSGPGPGYRQGRQAAAARADLRRK